MHSCIYVGHIRHRRFLPRANFFSYRLFLVYLDLSETDTAFQASRLWSVGKPNFAWLQRKDHFGDPSISIDETVRQLVYTHIHRRPKGPIRMLCHFRYFGHCFNPATFYFCFEPAGNNLDTIVIEVHNTPWGQTYCYVLDCLSAAPQDGWHYHQFPKSFHVSPFLGMDMHYDWRFLTPGPRLNIHMNNFHGPKKYFDATLTLDRQEINENSLNRVLFAYPVMTIKVVSMIYWQALRLWCKHIPFYENPHPFENQGSVLP